MYSVIRFTEIRKEEMEKIAILINRQIKDFCVDITPNRRDPHCFSFSLSSEENWWDHHEQIHDCLKIIGSAITKAKNDYPSLEIQIDIEIGGPDYASRFITEIYWTAELLCLLSKLNITLVASIYNPSYIEKQNMIT